MSIQDPSDYKTGNAVPSNAAMDVNDNAKVFDVFSNSKIPSVKSRLGVKIKTIWQQGQDFIESENARDKAFDAQFMFKRIKSFADANVNGEKITDSTRLNSYSTGTGESIEWWGLIQSTTIPSDGLPIPAAPDDNWSLVSSLSVDYFYTNLFCMYGLKFEGYWQPGESIPAKADRVDGYAKYDSKNEKILIPLNDNDFITSATVQEDIENRNFIEKIIGKRYQNNVCEFGADKTGSNDSTQAFIDSGDGSYIPQGTYKIEDDLPGVYQTSGNVVITGSGTVKTVPTGLLTRMINTPQRKPDFGGSTFGNYNLDIIDYSERTKDSINGELVWYRNPNVIKLDEIGGMIFSYQTMHYGKQDIGQTNTQLSGIRVKTSTDYGVTWSKSRNIRRGSSIGKEFSGGQMILDNDGVIHMFLTYANGIVGVGHGSTGYTNCLQTMVITSSDNGVTWSNPVDITPEVKPFNSTNFWLSPSPIIKTGDNEWLAGCAWTNQFGAGNFIHGYIRITKDENGLNYERQHVATGNGIGTTNGAAEVDIQQLADKSLIYIIRDYVQGGGQHQVFRSYDGVTWKHRSTITGTSSTKGGLCVFAQKAWGDNCDLLVFSNSTSGDPTTGRDDLRLFYSEDNGDTWTVDSSNYIAGRVGYSISERLHNSQLFVISESNDYTDMKLRTVSLPSYRIDGKYGSANQGVQIVPSVALEDQCRYFGIPNNSLFITTPTNDIGFNFNGTPSPLTKTRGEFLITNAWGSTLDTKENDTFRFQASPQNFSVITGKANKVVLFSTQSAAEITLTYDTNHPVPSERIVSAGTFKNKAIVLYPTSIGWVAASTL